MATFQNFATLTYSGGTTNSNTVTGEIVETLTMTKTALVENYTEGGDVTYVLSLVNSGTTPFTGLTVTDDLGGYEFDTAAIYPLAYRDGSVRYYINGVLQAAPAVTAGPPLVITGITVPAGGNAIVIYQADITSFAPLAADGTITNTATATGGGLTAPVTASETIATTDNADLSIFKSLSPTVVSENGEITYTFLIENRGNTPATAEDDVVLSDIFDPILSDIAVTLNGATVIGTGYSYNQTTGEFSTTPGLITVPAATYTQNPDGIVVITPGTAVVTVTGTV